MDRQTMNQIWPILISNRVEKVYVTYCGSGDSGSTDHPCLHPEVENSSDILATIVQVRRQVDEWDENATRWRKEWRDDAVPVSEILQDIAAMILEKRHAGWEINEGAEGVVIFDCSDYSVTLEHRQFERTYQDYVSVEDMSPEGVELIAIESQRTEVPDASE